jgi:hypothetical protein
VLLPLEFYHPILAKNHFWANLVVSLPAHLERL